MKSLWAAWPRLGKRILSSKKRLLLLDFDGTLAPIAKTPRAAAMDAATARRLESLSRARKNILAIVSGRSLKELKRLCPTPRTVYVGNHGLELAGRGLTLPAAAGKARRGVRTMRLLGQKLKSAFYFLPGVFVENKVYTLSLHFRNLRNSRKPVFDLLVEFFRDKYGKYPITWRRGKKAWEVRPSPEWNKGDMAGYLAKKFPSALPIAVGDDRTDEDMFRALKNGGVTVRVGRSEESAAHYYLRSQKEVAVLLEKLCR